MQPKKKATKKNSKVGSSEQNVEDNNDRSNGDGNLDAPPLSADSDNYSYVEPHESDPEHTRGTNEIELINVIPFQSIDSGTRR
ncbi:hypothetical protein CTI12_AA423560 [Artemisia annua]|uniref:Uncharacterized protein n=1 Tax=Artemisia annua TaxID=35608 RepID=A0A2U1M334_ARTAN|nr:hypothetical protein CTI12_AA423560 [Artemisia annua]